VTLSSRFLLSVSIPFGECLPMVSADVSDAEFTVPFALLLHPEVNMLIMANAARRKFFILKPV
jgi:hypothetical protein